MRASFRVEGLAGLTEDLLRYSEQVRVRTILATTQTREAVIQRARANAPRDRGDLANAIQGRGGGLVQLVGLEDRDIPARGGRNTAHRNPSVYGVWYEFGFTHRNIARHEFMGPAAEAEEGPHQERLIDALNGAAG